MPAAEVDWSRRGPETARSLRALAEDYKRLEAEADRLRAVVEAARTYRDHLVALRGFIAEHLNAPPTEDELAARVDATEAAFASLSAALDQRETT